MSLTTIEPYWDARDIGTDAALFMLPQNILDNLFNVKYRADDITLEHISEEFVKIGFRVTELTNLDMIIYFQFTSDNLSGELRVDRLRREFQLTITSEFCFPVIGDWNEIMKAICSLVPSPFDD